LNKIDVLAQIVWDYHLLHQTPEKADCILALGSNDLRIVDRAVDLFREGLAPVMIFSGNVGPLTKNVFTKPEAEVFAERAMDLGVPKSAILIENQSTNTGQNIEYTKKLLDEKGLNFNSFIVVQKPYMERRSYATFKKVWPEKRIIVTSPLISFDDYPNEQISKEHIINVMVGDLQRIKEYPAKGFQIHQDIPDKVWSAYEELVRFGFNKHLI